MPLGTLPGELPACIEQRGLDATRPKGPHTELMSALLSVAAASAASMLALVTAPASCPAAALGKP